MAVTCSGVIRDPSNNPVPNLRITLRSIGTNATSLDGAEIVVTTSADGSYSFPLQEGRYGVFMDFGERTFVGEVVILDTTIDDTLNQYLINVDFASVIGPALAEFEALRNECLQAVSDAEAQVALATTQAQLAAAQVALATAQVNLATVQADRAETEADRASQITGLDTVEEAVDLAITNEYLTGRTQGDVEAERALKRERFAGSGWEHFGKHISSNGFPIVNQGLNGRTHEGPGNQMLMGRTGSGQRAGLSKTNDPVMQMAGFTVYVEALNTTGSSSAAIKFSEAPTGAVTYDSATGTVFDFETQSDPKYGNIAPDRNEAVARAFEGRTRNSDFRNGDDFWNLGNTPLPGSSISTAGAVLPPGAGGLSWVISQRFTDNIEGETLRFTIEISGISADQDSVYLTNSISGARYVTLRNGLNTFEHSTSTLQNNWAVRNVGTTDTITVHSMSYTPVSQEVVTRRVDMWGFEGFLEEVNTGNPFVYPNGLIQSQATTMNGIPTVNSTRPVSYYAVFDGDITSVGRGVNFFAATAAQQEAMLNDPKNNLYRLDDGRLVQFRVRQRTIAGAGNGDWTVLHPNTLPQTSLRFTPTSEVVAQGSLDSVLVYAPNFNTGGGTYLTEAHTLSNLQERQLFTAVRSGGDSPAGVNGECYFLAGGTVSRLAQGAYHPEHNSFGSMQFRNDANNDDVNWNGSGLTGITSQLLCFTRAASGTGVIGQASGRTNDNRLFNAIYADGLGGVVDYRWSANDRSDPKWGAQAKLEAEAGEYRGLEKLVRTTIASGTLTVTETELDVSVSGDFSNPVIVGTPASVLARFPTGFEGRLLATQPTGSISSFPDIIRKHKSQGNALRWSGAAWASFSPTFNIDTNTWTLTNEPAANVVIFSTVNWANPTSRSANTALLNAQLGQYGVTATASSDVESGGLMFESMLGKVATSTATANGIIQTYPFMLLNLVPSTGMFDATAGRESQHAPLMLAAPTNNSRGIKYAAHQVNDNGQATLNFIFNELDHNGTDWGDDDRLRVLNGTYTNQNGVAGLLANVDTLAIPYGLIRNEV